MKELWRFVGALIALGCLCVGIWYGWHEEYAHACYLLLLSILNRPSHTEST